jgi:hypothetical protein
MRVAIPVLLCLLPAAGSAQLAVSVRAGLIQHIQGRAYVEDQRISTESYHFQHLNEGQCLRTERGRAEVVLAPGRILRLDRESAIELVSDDITDVRIALLRGSAYIDWDERFADGVITVVAGDAFVRIDERGLYRFNRGEEHGSELRVYGGKAVVESGKREQTVKSGRVLALAALNRSPEKFARDKRDFFDRWNTRRSLIVARMTAPPGTKRVRRRLGPPWNPDPVRPEIDLWRRFGPWR